MKELAWALMLHTLNVFKRSQVSIQTQGRKALSGSM
jgi:hypothetical protein